MMNGWLKVEYGFNAANETLNFGTRTLAEEDALYETRTLAIIGTDSQTLRKPIVQCLNKNSKIYIAIDYTFRIFSNNCKNMDLFTKFECLIDTFCISEDDSLIVLCLNDGSIYCLHIPSGGKLVCSKNVAEGSLEKCFLAAFPCITGDNSEQSNFIIFTKNYVFRLQINNITQLYQDINDGIEVLNVDYSFDKLDDLMKNSGLIEIEYNNNLYVASSVYKRCYDNGDPFIFAVNNEKHIIGICKMTKIIFDICNQESYEDLILLKSSDLLDTRMVILTKTNDDNSFVRLVSYPNFESIYNIKVSDTTYLVTSSSDQDEVMFIEGVCVADSLHVNELRLKVITESNLEVKLQRLLKRKCFEEAKEFARKHGLSMQSIFQAEAEEFIIKTEFHITDLEPFCAILDNVDDISFVVKCCINTTPDTLQGNEHLLTYANKRILLSIENNPGDDQFLDLRNTLLKISYKLETFKILHSDLDAFNSLNIIDKWAHFSCINLFDEMCNYLKNGKIDKCTIMFNRLQQEHDFDDKIISNLIKTMPIQTPLLDLIPLLRHMIMYCNENLPNSLPSIIKWIYNSILRFNTLKGNGLEYIFNFANYIQSFLFSNEFKCLNFHQYTLEDGCLTKFRKLMNSLKEMIKISKEFSIKISISNYTQDPKNVVYLLLDTVLSHHLHNFMNNFFLEYCCNNNLILDDILSAYIKKLTCTQSQSKYWEEKAKILISYINSNYARMDIILIIFEAADVPWNKFIEEYADNLSKEYPILAEKIKCKRNNIPWRILLKKYDIPQFASYDDEDVKQITRRVLLISKPEVFEDLDIIIQRYEHLKETCSIITFNHFVQIRNSEVAVNYVKKLPIQTLKRCLNVMLIQVRSFLFAKIPFYKTLETHVDILFSILYLLEKDVTEFEFDYYNTQAIKLKNIYLLKNYFACTEIYNENLELSTLFEKVINDIIISVNRNECSWSDAINKCETIAHLIGVKKATMFTELINRTQSLQLLIEIANNMIKCESKPMDICEIAIIIMKNIGNGSVSDSDSNSDESHTAVEALKLIRNLALNACINANSVDLLIPCTILNWISACDSLQRNKHEPQWTITPVYKPDGIAVPSAKTVTILRDFFNIFLKIAETRMKLPIQNKAKQITSEHKSINEWIVECIESLPKKIQQLHVEGYDMVSYHLLSILKNEILYSGADVNFTSEVKNRINLMINSSCVPQLLYKLFVQNDIDQQFALSLYLQPKFDPIKWTLFAIKKYKNNIKQLSTAANLVCSYAVMKGESVKYEGYFHLRNRCSWWQKFLHQCVSYNDTFQLDPDKIMTEYLLKSDKFTLKLLQQFSKDFNLNEQKFLPTYLRYILLQWKPDIEIVKDPKLASQGNTNTTEYGPFSKCKDIIYLMKDRKAAIDQLNAVWSEISYYQYEVYFCMLDLSVALDLKCLNPESRALLLYLINYVRIMKPRQKEIDDWQTKYPFSTEIDPISEYRLPYLFEMSTKNLWEIIGPEINLLTYDRWFETANILKLERDDICTYAIRGIVYIFNSNERKWSESSKQDSLLKNLEKCVSKIQNLEVATATLYQATCKVSGGADQVAIAKMCWEMAIHWKKSVPNAPNMSDVLMKVQRKYLNCVSMHILYTHNLGTQNYLALIDNTEMLIRELYQDESIITRTKGTIMYYPDINSAVDQFGKQLGIDVNEIRTTLIMKLLQEADTKKTVNKSFYSQSEVKNYLDLEYISDNLKRIIYICESNTTEGWTNLLFNITFSKLDETLSEFVTSTDLSMQIKALQCLLVISKNTDELEAYIGQPANIYVEKLQILITLESIGYLLTVQDLDSCNKSDLINKILQTNSSNPLVVKSISKLLSLYEIWDSNIWNNVLISFTKLIMLPELQLWLPKLYKICYTSSVKCNYSIAWECLITNTFIKAINDHCHFASALLLMQLCPIIYKFDFCLLNIFNCYYANNIFEVCAMFIPYLNEENKNKCLQILKSHRTNELYDKIQKLSFHGILNTDCKGNIHSQIK